MTKIEQQVMGGVAVIYAARALVSATAMKCYALLLSGLGLMSLVSVPTVIANLELEGAGGFFTFTEVAILKTQIAVQLILLVGVAVLFSLFADALRAVRRTATA